MLRLRELFGDENGLRPAAVSHRSTPKASFLAKAKAQVTKRRMEQGADDGDGMYRTLYS